MLAEAEAGSTSTQTCEVCGTEAPLAARFCKACGASLKAPSQCPACGSDVPEGSRFCPACGARLVGARPSSMDSVVGPELQEPPSEAGPLPSKEVSAPPELEPPGAALDETRAKQEIERAIQPAPQPRSSPILPNLLLFFALLVAIVVVIREMNQGKEKEVSPFEAPPPTSAMTPSAPTDSPKGPAGPNDIAGRVSLDPSMAPAPKGTLYIIARIQGGPERGPPIAVKRIAEPRFPARFRLTPADVMQPGTPFEGPFDIRARLDTDGNAMTKSPGDLGTQAAVSAKPGSAHLELVLDERIE